MTTYTYMSSELPQVYHCDSQQQQAAVTIDCQRDGHMNKLRYTTISHTAKLVDKIRLDFLKLTVF